MAYNFYQNPYQTPDYFRPQPQPQPQPVNNGGINWVQGEAGAKSFLVGAGNSVLLMDSEDSVFYIKSTDMSGMPQPLRVFEYKERMAQKQPLNEQDGANSQITYVTHEELEKRLSELNLSKDGDSVG